MEYSIRVDERGFEHLENVKLSNGDFYEFPVRSVKGLIILKNTSESLTYFNRDSDTITTIWFEPGWETQLILDI